MLLKLAGTPQTQVLNIPTDGDKPEACAGRLNQRGHLLVLPHAPQAEGLYKSHATERPPVMLKGVVSTTMDKQSLLVSLSSELMQQLHKEFRKRVLYEQLEYTPEEEALDQIFVFAQVDPVRFHESWIRPLLCEGISIEAAFAHIMDSCFQPN